MANSPEKELLPGVVTKTLTTHIDERGFFREIIRVTDNFFSQFGQWSHSRMYQGVVKAWHYHRQQTDWWYVVTGVLKVGLHDLREDSPTRNQTVTLLMGEGQPAQILTIPPGVAHGCRCLSGPADLFYVTSHVYNPEDEGRIPHDDPDIGFDWLEGPPIT